MRDTLAQLLAESPTREWMVYLLSTVPGLPPIAQSFHILGIAAVVGSIGMVDLRFLGLALRNQNVSEMIHRLLPWTFVALAVNLVTGSLFVLARPVRYVYNPVVSFKLACLIPAVAMAFAIWWMNRREHGYWERTPARLGTARAIAVVSLCCWIGVMLAGRWIAYSEYITDPFYFPFAWEELAAYPSIWQWIQDHPIAQHIGFTWWFPFLESIHVIAIGLVVGSIMMVDLRLLGLAALRYPASQVTRKLIPWTWGAFVVAAITGFGLFATRATGYVDNTAFQIKFLLLPLACLNMAWFQFRTFRGVTVWDTAADTPMAAKLAGGISLLLWAGIILAGRWTGHLI
ncbi:MAG: hypothetical protein F4W89_12800 [Acidobacteria bacterium]|nr:hypothetical protein [Acidobacteriota bacterium]